MKNLKMQKIKSFLRSVLIIVVSVIFIGYSNQSIFATKSAVNSPTELSNPLGDNMTDPNLVIGKIINSVLGVVGTIALAMFIYGGFRWMTAAGGKDGVQAGKDTIVWATFGLIIIFTSYAIVNFVLSDILIQSQ